MRSRFRVGVRRTVVTTTVGAVTVALAAVVGAAPSAASPVGTPPYRVGGSVYAWGDNSYGQTTVPAALTGQTVTAISAGPDHVMALTAAGNVVAWGNDNRGDTDVPTSVNSQRITAIAAGNAHSLALTAAGTVLAWGDDDSGQTDIPAALAGKTVTAIAAGDFFSVAVTSDGKVTEWGDDASGGLDVPAAVQNSYVTAIATGSNHILALDSAGNVYAWGNDDKGQIDVPAQLNATVISAGTNDSAAIAADGTVHLWGDPSNGATTPPVNTLSYSAVAVGLGFTLALSGGNGQSGSITVIGGGSAISAGAQALINANVTAVAAGGQTAYALVAPVNANTGPPDATFSENIPTYIGDTQFAPGTNTDGTYCNSVSNNRSHLKALVGLGVDYYSAAGPLAAANGYEPGIAGLVTDCRQFVGETAQLDYSTPPVQDAMRGSLDSAADYPPLSVLCPTGQVITGVDVNVTPNEPTGPLQDIRPYCSVLGANGVPSSVQTPQAWARGNSGVPGGTALCNPGTFAVDIAGDDGQYDDDLSLICFVGSYTASTAQPANSAWTTATLLGANDTTTQALTTGESALWYKLPVQPTSTVQVSLSNLAANDDLTVFSDLGKAFTSLTSTTDLTRLSADAAGVSFSPTTFSPTTFSPTTFSPTTFSPTTFSPTTFSPTTFSPTTFSPTTFSPTTFSPTTFSPYTTPDEYTLTGAFNDTSTFTQAYTSAQTQSFLGESANDGTAPEALTGNTGSNTGFYYLRVTARNGQGSPSPYTVSVTTTGGPCTTTLNNYQSDATLTGTPGPATVLLTDSSRLTGSAADTAALAAANSTFARSVSGGAAVVDLAASRRVQDLDAQADANPNCPYAKDLVAQSIRDIVNSYRGGSGALKYVVLEGGDNVIPYFRYVDASGVADESGFVPPVTSSSASAASIANDMVLSQDAYGAPFDITIHGATMPIPDLAVGRLISTPAQIATTLTNYTNGTTANIPISSTLSTGYDFLAQASKQIAQTFAAADPGGVNDTLITNQGVSRSSTTVNGTPAPTTSWTATDLKNAFVNKRHDLVYLAAHFSPNLAEAADYATALSTHDLATAAPTPSKSKFLDSLVISPGCHSGYNIVGNDAVSGVTDTLDWATELAAQGATLIGGTGFQYGDTDFVKYSNALYVQLATDLRQSSGPLAIGSAFVQAKQDYLSAQASVSGIDEKSLLESTLYGLPMQTVSLPAAGRIAPPTAPTPVATTPITTGAGATLGLSTTSVTVTPGLTSHSTALTSNSGSTVNATYLTGPGGQVESEPAAPTLPLTTQNATAPSGTVLRGVGFWSGTYTDTTGVTPLTGAPATETNTTHGPFVSSVFYPSVLATPNYFGALGGSAANGATNLAVTPAQYQSDGPGSLTDTQRAYAALGFHLFYSGNRSTYGPNTPALAAAPTMSGTTASVGSGGTTLTFSTHVVGDPSAGIQDAWVTWTDPNAAGSTKQWSSLELTQDSTDSTLWTATLTLPAGDNAGDVRYLVQAVNGVGEVGADDNVGHYYQPATAATASPVATTLALAAANPASVVSGGSLSVSATLAAADGSAVGGLPVVFTTGGSSVIAPTDSTGKATAVVPVNAAPGTATVSVSFAGTSSLLASSDGPHPLTVTKRAAAIALTSAGHGAFTVRLSDVSGSSAVGLPSHQVFVVATSAAGTVLKTLTLLTAADGTAAVQAASIPALSTGLTAYFGSATTPTSGASFNATDPVFRAATPSTVPFAPDHIGVAVAGASTISSGGTAALQATAYDGATPADSLGDLTAASTFTIVAKTGGSNTGASCTGATCTATIAGTYTITASYRISAQNLTLTASTTVVVIAGPAATVTAVSGTPQSAVSGSNFATPLGAQVIDASGNPVAGARVLFTIAPASSTTGGATFAGNALTATVTTGSTGMALSPVITAGAQVGPVTVLATVTGTSVPAASFELAVTAKGSSATADLAVSLSAPSSAVANSSVQATITVTNAGPAVASKLGTVLVIPNGWTVSNAGGGTVLGKQVVLFTAASLAVRATLTYSVTLTVGPRAGLTLLGAGALSSVADSNYRNNVTLGLVTVKAH